MALLRTARLFLKTVPVGRLDIEAPGPLGEPSQHDQVVYGVPWGSRAILRTFTAVCEGSPSVDPAPFLHLKVWQQGDPGPIAVFFRFLRAGSQTQTQDQLSTYWNAHLVLNEGENLMIYNGTGTALNVHGSGALMPIPQALRARGTGSTMGT